MFAQRAPLGAAAVSVSARQLDLLRCHDCGQLARRRPAPERHALHCPRCDARLHMRKPNSLSRTWAFVIAAFILYIPANLLPVSTITKFGKVDTDTIMSGVIRLFQGGDGGVGLLLFVASIAVPLVKLGVLSWLALSVHYRWLWRPRDRSAIFRLVDVIGRWSMLDIFVIGLLVALVRLEALASIRAEPGALAFAAVVILTLFAAESFDARLIWDAQEPES